MGEVVEAVTGILRCLGAPIYKCMKDHMRLDERMNVLKEKRDDLDHQEEERKIQREAERSPGKTLRPTVKHWFEKVEKIKGNINSIEEVKKRKFLTRARLTKKVDKMIEDVNNLLREGHSSDNLFINNPPKKRLEFPPNPIELDGQIEKRDEILSYLMGDEVAKIGVCGLGGVGKTTIMRLITNQLSSKGEEKFDRVIWVTVPKDHEIDILSALDESITEPDKERRAAKTFERLKDIRFVLILIGVWKAFDLKELGIPGSLENNGCKLVLTTRSMDVCRSMGCKMVKVDTLREEEARSLFLEKVGFDIFNDPNSGYIANLVLGKCGGLPLAISAVGRAMRDVRDIQMWRSALNELTQGNWSNMEYPVLELLKVSYDKLGDERVQQCFLYCCCCYPEDKEIPKKELIESWISGGYLNDIGSTQANLDMGHAILSKLENNGLLEKYGDGDCSVKMHTLIRDTALYIIRTMTTTPAKVDHNILFNLFGTEDLRQRLSTITTSTGVVDDFVLMLLMSLLAFFPVYCAVKAPGYWNYGVHQLTSKTQEILGRLLAAWSL